MHLQLNLSNQLAKQWKPPLSDAPPETHPLLRWRLDKMKLGRTTANYVCVNEETLFSFVLAGAAGRKAADLQQHFISRLLNLLDYHHFPAAAFELFDRLAVLFGKTECRKVIASVTGIRHGYNVQYEYTGVSQVVAEHRVNSTPMRGPDCFYPYSRFLALRALFPDREGRFLDFTLPRELWFCANRNLCDSFAFPLFCFSRNQETARVSVEDLMHLHDAVMEALELNLAKAEDIFLLNRLANLLLDAVEGYLSDTE